MAYSAPPQYYDSGMPGPGYYPRSDYREPVNYQQPVNYPQPVHYQPPASYRNRDHYVENYKGGPIYSEPPNSEDGFHRADYEGVENYRVAQNDTGDDPNEQAARHERYLKRKRDRYLNTKQSFEDWDFDRNWRKFTIMPRSWWRALPPNHSAPLQHPVDIVLLTYSHGRTCQNTYHCSWETKRIQNTHLANGAVDIVFNFVIGGNGQVFEGRGWNASPRLNHRLQRFACRSLHIGFLGNLRSVMPSDTMLDAARELIEFGVMKGFIAPKFLEYSTKLWVPPHVSSDSEVLKALGQY